MTPTETALSKKMRGLARIGHVRADELREKADAFDVAAAGYYSPVQTVTAPSFLGAYARARKLYCECTGEPLV